MSYDEVRLLGARGVGREVVRNISEQIRRAI